jgi:hypothetical protein
MHARAKVEFQAVAESCFPLDEITLIKPFTVFNSLVDLLACHEWDAFCGR